MLADCFYAVRTHQLEFANTSLPTFDCRVKAALITSNLTKAGGIIVLLKAP